MEIKSGYWYKRKGSKTEWLVDYVEDTHVNVVRYDYYDAHKITGKVNLDVFIKNYILVRGK